MTDWTTDATDAIDKAVATVRERTVEPAQSIVKGVVFGLLAALLLVPAAVLLAIMVFRLLVIAAQGEVWAVWLGIGVVLVGLGVLVFSKRTP